MNTFVIILTLFISVTADPLQDLGAPDYTCDASLMAPSKVKPTNVHSVRPADINLVMALGDSLTAANGADATDIIQVALQYRGLAFLAGGDKGLDKHITIPNILQKYNPNVFGQSYGIGSSEVWDVAYLNMGYPGALASSLPKEAQQLVDTLNFHSDESAVTAEIFAGSIQKAIQIVKDNIPRVIVNLVTVFQFELVRQIDDGVTFCEEFHIIECNCERNSNETIEVMKNISQQFQIAQKELETSGIFEAEDFTLVTQPFLNDVSTPPLLPNGSVNHQLFAPDCFHFSEMGHALVASWLWKNMLEPVGSKTTQANLSTPAIPLACPDTSCPFIRTTKNSQNCQQYFTPSLL
uniref:Uncharacterized protein n=1 Tax=Acrobeloides nanus TaxID=290746 RepID=A0A914DIZ3_9BILA